MDKFSLPPSRTEAMYAPEMFGEAPHARIKVAAVKRFMGNITDR